MLRTKSDKKTIRKALWLLLVSSFALGGVWYGFDIDTDTLLSGLWVSLIFIVVVIVATLPIAGIFFGRLYWRNRVRSRKTSKPNNIQ